jgi:hypothetical protein
LRAGIRSHWRKRSSETSGALSLGCARCAHATAQSGSKISPPAEKSRGGGGVDLSCASSWTPSGLAANGNTDARDLRYHRCTGRDAQPRQHRSTACGPWLRSNSSKPLPPARPRPPADQTPCPSKNGPASAALSPKLAPAAPAKAVAPKSGRNDAWAAARPSGEAGT